MSYRVPSKDYAAQYRALWPALSTELSRVLTEENPILGASVAAFEREFAAHCGAADAVGVGSGTAALVLALRSAGVGPGDSVVVPGHTFMATVSAVLLVGATPRLVDADPDTMNASAAAMADAVRADTRALIAVHMYGLLAPMAELRAAVAGQRLTIIEDAAQAHGAGDPADGRAGALGDLGCFSFHPSKNLGAFGDAGTVTVTHPDSAHGTALRELRNLGKTEASKYHFAHVAPNSKLDTLQAALLRLKLPSLDALNTRRRALATRYATGLADLADLRLPTAPDAAAHVYHQFVVRTERRDALRAHLKRRGINAGSTIRSHHTSSGCRSTSACSRASSRSLSSWPRPCSPCRFPRSSPTTRSTRSSRRCMTSSDRAVPVAVLGGSSAFTPLLAAALGGPSRGSAAARAAPVRPQCCPCAGRGALLRAPGPRSRRRASLPRHGSTPRSPR